MSPLHFITKALPIPPPTHTSPVYTLSQKPCPFPLPHTLAQSTLCHKSPVHSPSHTHYPSLHFVTKALSIPPPTHIIAVYTLSQKPCPFPLPVTLAQSLHLHKLKHLSLQEFQYCIFACSWWRRRDASAPVPHGRWRPYPSGSS